MYKYDNPTVKLFFFLLIAVALYLSSLYNYLLFHSIAEIFSIVVGFSLFTIVWHSRKFYTQDSNYLVFIGISYFFISLIDILHMLSYKGIDIFDHYEYPASQLWIAARYLESISFVLPFLFFKLNKKINQYIIFVVYLVITIVFLSLIFYFRIFPQCFIEGKGQTPFKIVSEYLICFILILAAILMIQNKDIFEKRVYRYLLFSIGATVASELAFTRYVNVYDVSNLLGHYLKIISFYLIYKAIIIKSIKEPFECAYYELKERKKALGMYKSLFDSIDECFGIIEVNYDCNKIQPNFHYVEINRAFEREMGLPQTDGKLFNDITEENDALVLNILEKIVFKGESIRTSFEIKSSKIWYSVFFFRIDQEETVKVGVLFKNITEEINEKNEIEKNMKMQNEIFANISHELKTPLNVIFTTTQLLEAHLKSNSIESIRNKNLRYIDITKKNCYRFTKLINNIVDLSKIDQGTFELDIKGENIVSFVEELVSDVAEFIEEKNFSIVFDTNCEEQIVDFDADKIERVLLNLISNAIKFSDKENEILVQLSAKDKFLEIAVRDAGSGIERRSLNYIFDRYYQVDKTLSRNAEGIGIGLTLVKSIVAMHGGTVSVHSKIGQGSTFSIRLPMSVKTIQAPLENTKLDKLDRTEMIRIEFADIYMLDLN